MASLPIDWRSSSPTAFQSFAPFEGLQPKIGHTLRNSILYAIRSEPQGFGIRCHVGFVSSTVFMELTSEPKAFINPHNHAGLPEAISSGIVLKPDEGPYNLRYIP